MEAEEPATFCQYMFHYLNFALSVCISTPDSGFFCPRSNILLTFFKFSDVLGDLPVHIGILANFDLILIVIYYCIQRLGGNLG